MSYQEFLWRLKMVHGDCICLKTGKQRESAVSGVFRLYQGYFGCIRGISAVSGVFRLYQGYFGCIRGISAKDRNKIPFD